MSSEPLSYLSMTRRYDDPDTSFSSDIGRDDVQLEALHTIALLILRSHDLYATFPEIARIVRDLSGLQIVSLSLGEQVWIHPDDDDDDPPSLFSSNIDPVAGETTAELHDDPGRIIHFDADDSTGESGDLTRIPIPTAGNPDAFMLALNDNRSPLGPDAVSLLGRVGEMLAAAAEREQRPADSETNDDGAGQGAAAAQYHLPSRDTDND